MPKRTLTESESNDLRRALHVATLEALMASRRWAPGDLAFQGGTSLHLVHGSPRFSEDLDFLVRAGIQLDELGPAIKRRLAGTPWIPVDAELSVRSAKDDHNPHNFVVSISGPGIIGSVKVKVELWKPPADAISAVKAVVSPVRLASGPAAGAQAFVPTLELAEIYADKVFALVARPKLKARDVFDLHWLTSTTGRKACSVDAMRVRLATYPNQSAGAWLAQATRRRAELVGARDVIARDLRRWLPSSWPLDAGSVAQMIESSVAALDQGVTVMQALADAASEHAAPGP